MAVPGRAPRIAPIPRRRAAPGRMPTPLGAEADGDRATPSKGSTAELDESAVAHFSIPAGVLPAHLSGNEVLPMSLPKPNMTPHDVTAIWEQDWGVTYASRVKFQITDEMGKPSFLKPRLDSIPLAPAVVNLVAVGSILTTLATAFAQRTKLNSERADEEGEEVAFGQLSAEEHALLKEQLLKAAQAEEQEVAERERHLQELRWQQAKSRQSLMAKKAVFEQQDKEAEEREKEWQRVEEEHLRRQVDRQERLEREGRKEMLAEKLMWEDEEAEHERLKAQAAKQREEREARRAAWEATEQEFQRMEEQYRDQLPSEKVSLVERLLRDTAAQR